MNCQDFLRHIEDELLSRPEAAVESLRAHLAECEQTTCREFLDEVLVVEQAVRAWRQPIPQVDVADAVVSRWQDATTLPQPTESPQPVASPALQRATSPPPTTPAPASRSWPVVLAVAVLMMMLPLLVPDRSDDSGPAVAPPVAVVETERPTENPDPEPRLADDEPHTEIVRDRSIAYYNAAQHATRMVTDAVVLVLPDDDPSSQFEDPTHVPEWVGRWEEQIEPLKTQFDSAVRSLMDVLPEPMPAT
ncbi:hypothetical protein Mal4_30920 [Maioricimonas rarisocia]|uniref:Zinc-finger domain-containing protein n=1 Tax=Maioricimonas rarisocia TaxID=2528026 RepID=A0A517Z8E4_9PLAN|nr:hypothetical protein [Maioricimonas rarisocia]QDU38762.1 hypothetical protein Mal4_30920 [Maioricimonas rarisocia]